MVTIINAAVFILGTYFAIKAGRAILKGTRYSINFVMIVFYIFFIVPLAFDIIFGIPRYTYELSFKDSSADLKTCILYALYVAFVPVLWQWTAIGRRLMEESHSPLENRTFSKLICLTMLIIPIVLALLSPNPAIYLTYGASILGFPSLESESYHMLITASTFFSVICFSYMLIGSKKGVCFFFIRFSPFLLATIWLNGKRNIILWTLVLILYALWKRKSLTAGKLFITVILFLSIGLGLSVVYQQTLRYDNLKVDNWEEIYTNMRVDYGRDDVTKMAIYAEIEPNHNKILEFRGQSMLHNLLFFIPREVWPDKPWPYAVYATSALLKIPIQYIGWGMTTSILDEAIANFSWLGMLIGPLIVSIICRIGDREQGKTIQLLTILVAILMIVLQLSAFTPIFLIWAFLIVYNHIKRRIQKPVWYSVKKNHAG